MSDSYAFRMKEKEHFSAVKALNVAKKAKECCGNFRRKTVNEKQMHSEALVEAAARRLTQHPSSPLHPSLSALPISLSVVC